MDYEKLIETLGKYDIAVPDRLHGAYEKAKSVVPESSLPATQNDAAKQAQDCFQAIRLLITAAHAQNPEIPSPSHRAAKGCDTYAEVEKAYFTDCFDLNLPTAQRRPAWDHMCEASNALRVCLHGNSNASDATAGEKELLAAATKVAEAMCSLIRKNQQGFTPELVVHAGGVDKFSRPYPSELKQMPAAIARVWKGATPLPLHTQTITFLQDEAASFSNGTMRIYAPDRADMAHLKFNETIDRLSTAKEMVMSIMHHYFPYAGKEESTREKLLQTYNILFECEKTLANMACPLIATKRVSEETLIRIRGLVRAKENEPLRIVSDKTIELCQHDCDRDTLWLAMQDDVTEYLDAIKNSISLEGLRLPKDTGPYHVIVMGEMIQLIQSALEQSQNALQQSGPATSKSTAQGRF